MMMRIGCLLVLLSITACADGLDRDDRLTFSAVDISRNQPLDEAVVNRANQLSCVAEQFDYLAGLVSGPTSNRQKSTALCLLGESQSTNAIPILLDNLTFRDEDTKTCPTVRALASIGEVAVEPIFEYIQTTTNQVAAVRGAEAIQMIKCRGADCSAYVEWLKPRFDNLPKHLQEALGVIER